MTLVDLLNLTPEEQAVVDGMGDVLTVDASKPMDDPSRSISVPPTDEQKRQRVRDYRHHNEIVAEAQARESARSAALAKLSAAGDDYAPTVKDLKDLGIL